MSSILIFKTVKCLLIVPNPESALNEEAGKLLLEDYDEYSSRAKLYTEIHARNKNQSSKSSFYQSSTESVAAHGSTLNNINPLDSNKTIHTTSNNSNGSGSSDEPNCKMAKLQTNVQQQEKDKAKKNDKKKALKRL